jgi:hypothetical protein
MTTCLKLKMFYHPIVFKIKKILWRFSEKLSKMRYISFNAKLRVKSEANVKNEFW